MATGPFVVGISELRRHLAGFVEEASRSEHPLFVTHHGSVMAVLISKEQWDSCRREHRRRTDASGETTPPTRSSPRRQPPQWVRDVTLPPERRVWTRYGWCEFETAQVLAEQGVETELVWADEGWLTDDEG